MSFPFVVHDDLMQIDKSNVFIYKKVFQNEEMEIIKKAIDEHTPFSEEYIISDEGNCNVKSKFTTFNVISQQNPEIGKIVTCVLKKIQRKISSEICPHPTTVGYNNSMQFRKINGATRMHTDGVLCPLSMRGRIFSVIVALNSDYEGGEFEFPLQNIKVKLKAGEALIFPPYWTHPHCTNELNGTFRYTINTWLTEFVHHSLSSSDLKKSNLEESDISTQGWRGIKEV